MPTFADELEKFESQPIFLVEIILDSTTKRYSNSYIRTSSGIYYPKVKSFGNFSRSIGDDRGSYEISSMTINFFDTDREFRKLIASDYILNRRVNVKLGFGNLELTQFKTIFSGFIEKYNFPSNLEFSINLVDIFAKFDIKIPKVKITQGDFPNAYSEHLGKVAQIVHGNVSELNKGALECWYVDKVNFKYMVAMHSIYSVDGVFKEDTSGNITQLTTGFSVMEETIGGQLYTLLDFTSDQGELNKIYVNLKGRKDGAGQLMEEPTDCLKDFLQNFVGIDLSDINTISFDNAKIISQDRKYKCAGAITKEKNLKDILDEFGDSFDLDIYVDFDGKIAIKILDYTLQTGAPVYDWKFDILDRFDINPNFRIINKLRYGYSYNFAKDYFSNYKTLDYTLTQTNYKKVYKEFIPFYFVRDETTASDVAQRRLLRFRKIRDFVNLETPLKILNKELSDIIKITHFEGISVDDIGYLRKYFQIRSFNIDLENSLISSEVEDIHYWASLVFILGDKNVLPQFWTQTNETEKVYGYLCDKTTGKFSNGDEGKSLY